MRKTIYQKYFELQKEYEYLIAYNEYLKIEIETLQNILEKENAE